jgi:hypothetical protein
MKMEAKNTSETSVTIYQTTLNNDYYGDYNDDNWLKDKMIDL